MSDYKPTFKPSSAHRPLAQRLTPLAFAMYGACVLYSSAMCLRMNATGAGWLGVVVFLLYMLAMAARARTPQPNAQLTEAASIT
jgi:hypothetical protein